MAKRSFMQSVGDALAGVAATWRTQRSFRIQAVLAAALPVILAWLRPPLVFSALCLTMAMLVLAAELFNTALERLADHLHPEHHPAIGAAKDCAAGAVLLVCAGAGLVGILTLVVVFAER
ncbi:Diacylglycerol kinase [Paraburkholderia piptadeniae]|uniref:Diacylglycerol kinase n=1 Tax=Paraburkholderia piptadeniae TaxID=1701573 RepID=A0A1N7SA81_9BURK|nr:diacylglycerol kinase [Paraburkholderia piptadeniae]SIT43888.1 Diacylglycerol kinase [Paraburkholderia piptadeniae]